MQFDDQGLLNTDPRSIAIAINQNNPGQYINLFPTDVQGLSFSRTPQQVGSHASCLLSCFSQICTFRLSMLHQDQVH